MPSSGVPSPIFQVCFILKIFLNFLEPIGGAAPKFAHELKGSLIFKKFSESISLSCPAQGFPIPAFRWVIFLSEIYFVEPIGGSAPKFAHESKGSILLKNNEEVISLSCPAQGFPVPAFRFVLILFSQNVSLKFLEPIGGAKPKFSYTTKVLHMVHQADHSISLACPAQGFPIPTFRCVKFQFLKCRKISKTFRAHWWSKA